MSKSNEPNSIRFLLGFCIWAVTFLPAKSAEVPVMVEKIIVHKGVVITCNRQENASELSSPDGLAIYGHAWILEQSKAPPAIIAMETDDPYLRWTIAHNLWWWSAGEGIKGKGFPQRQGIEMFHFGRKEVDLLQREALKASDGGPKSLNSFGIIPPLLRLALPTLPMRFSQREIYHDIHPVSEKTLQAFILTNVPWDSDTPKPVKLGEAPKESQPAVREGSTKPKWSLTVHTSSVTWLKKTKQENERWAWGDWIMTEALPVRFQERFQLVVQKGAYYFITESGKVYVSMKPEKGKERTMEELWTDKEQPVIAFVQDADNDRTYAFTKNKKKDEKNFYFELADKPKPVAYNLADAKPPKDLKEPLKSALPYVQILIADHKYKLISR